MAHIPVLLQETLEYLDARNKNSFVDATVGGGGHTTAILEANAWSQVLGIDLDQTSLDKLREELAQKGLDQRCTLVQGNYKDLEKILADTAFGSADGILLDLGFSSMQLDDPVRGFSFQTEGPLDMRYDPNAKRTAAEVVNRYHEPELARIISEYGEEKFSHRIARRIIEARKQKSLASTTQLAGIVRLAIPLPIRFKSGDSVRRVFQAIRIEVNSELENLQSFLPRALASLSPGGRLVVISFHSLEDRIVKEFFNREAKDCICPPEFPTCVCGKNSTLRILTKKPVVAQAPEQTDNPRSKSAKLRAAQKI